LFIAVGDSAETCESFKSERAVYARVLASEMADADYGSA
jgi:hypothetical protein